MTATLVITHVHGVIAAFTVDPGGELTQRAIIDTGTTDEVKHLELARLGIELAERYGWTNGAAPAQRSAGRPRALPTPTDPGAAEALERKRAKARTYAREYYARKRSADAQPVSTRKRRVPNAAGAQRRARLLDWVRGHPDSLTADMYLALADDYTGYPSPSHAVSAIGKDLRILMPAVVPTLLPLGDPRRNGNAPTNTWSAAQDDGE